jgi:hypothetical protein
MTATAVRRLPTIPADPELPRGGTGAVARFLAGRGLDPQRIEPAQAHYRPGRWLTVCFCATGLDRGSGRPVDLTVTVDCRAGEAPEVWAFPDDPALPGLAAAADPDGRLVRRRLRPSPARVTVEPVRYRPRRRAVVRYRVAGGGTLFGKVMTPRRARRLLALADRLGDPDPDPGLGLALPAGLLAPGALLLPRLSGRPLRNLLLAGDGLPCPEALAGLPDRLHRRAAAAVLAGPPAPKPGPAAGSGAATPGRRRIDPVGALAAAHVVARLLPGEACAAGRLAEAVVAWSESDDPPDDLIVHGDLYENQILIDGDTFGLIDLDDLGPGDPLLDAANFSAHLLLLATSGTPAAAVIGRYRDELRAAFARRLDADPAALAWREAYCLLRLVTGPFRVLHPDWRRRMADRLVLAAAALPGRRT